MVRTALDLGTPSLREVAREAGITYSAARAYRAGQRTPSPDVRRRLADALRRLANRMRASADELEYVSQGDQ